MLGVLLSSGHHHHSKLKTTMAKAMLRNADRWDGDDGDATKEHQFKKIRLREDKFMSTSSMRSMSDGQGKPANAALVVVVHHAAFQWGTTILILLNSVLMMFDVDFCWWKVSHLACTTRTHTHTNTHTHTRR